MIMYHSCQLSVVDLVILHYSTLRSFLYVILIANHFSTLFYTKCRKMKFTLIPA